MRSIAERDPHVTRVFPGQRHVPHGAAAAGRGFCRGNAVGFERGLGPGAMVLQLGGEVGGVAAGARPVADAADQAGDALHSHR